MLYGKAEQISAIKKKKAGLIMTSERTAETKNYIDTMLYEPIEETVSYVGCMLDEKTEEAAGYIDRIIEEAITETVS